MKTKIIIFLLMSSISSCSKSVSNEINSEFIIKTKNIKEKILKNNNILHIDAKIPFMENTNFEFENFIKNGKKKSKIKYQKPKVQKMNIFIFQALQYFKMKILALHLFYIKNP